MRICDLCDSRDTVKQFALVMQPLDDKPVTPFERDLCPECAEFVHGQLKAIVHGRRVKTVVAAKKRPKQRQGSSYV